MTTKTPAEKDDGDGFGRLLVQLGFHVAGRFTDALAPLGLQPRHVRLLRSIAAHEGQSQQALGEVLGLNPTRVVFLVDDLEALGLVERRRNTADRRSHALFLAAKGRDKLRKADAATAAQDSDLGSSLSPADRVALTGLLRRVAEEQGLNEDALPGSPPSKRGA